MNRRQKIIDAIIARMQTITQVNGYSTDIGLNVHDWRINFQDEELPAISVCDLISEDQLPAGASNPKRVTHLLNIQIRIYAPQEATPANIREMIADVSRAIGTDDRWIEDNAGLVITTRPLRHGFLIPPESFEVIGGFVEIEAVYITDKWNLNN